MQQVRFKDYESIKDIFRNNQIQNALNIISHSGHCSDKGLSFQVKQPILGCFIDFDVYYIFDRPGIDIAKDEIYEELTLQDSNMLNTFLFGMLDSCRDVKWSKGNTSFATLQPPAFEIDGLIGHLVFINVVGPDSNAPKAIYNFIRE